MCVASPRVHDTDHHPGAVAVRPDLVCRHHLQIPFGLSAGLPRTDLVRAALGDGEGRGVGEPDTSHAGHTALRGGEGEQSQGGVGRGEAGVDAVNAGKGVAESKSGRLGGPWEGVGWGGCPS